MCCGKVVFPAPCSSVPHLPLGQPLFHRTFKPWKEREQVLFPELPWGVRGAELWPRFPLPFRGGRRAEPGPHPQDMAQVWGQHCHTWPFLHPRPSLLVRTPTAFRLMTQPVLLLSSIPQHCQGVDAALGAGLSVQPSHSPWVLHPCHVSPQVLPMLIWVCF